MLSWTSRFFRSRQAFLGVSTDSRGRPTGLHTLLAPCRLSPSFSTRSAAMIKKALFTVIALGLTTVVLFGRDAASYVSTTYGRLTGSVKECVPIEFQIDRARAMVKDL